MGLIVNADDFGMFDSANRGILYCLKNRLINSVSVCVNYKSNQVLTDILNFREQLLSLGLHINLTEGYSLISSREYLDSLSLYNNCKSKEYYLREIEEQILKFKKIFGFLPEHLDCHQHYVYFDKNAFSAYVDLSNLYQIPIRSTYAFSSKQRLKVFFSRLKERYGIEVFFKYEEIVLILKSFKVKKRSKVVALNLDKIDVAKVNHLEIVCHPKLSSDGRINSDLKILKKNKLMTTLSEKPSPIAN